MRFDLVVRWYLLEKAEFDIVKAQSLAINDQDLRSLFYKAFLVNRIKYAHAVRKTKKIGKYALGLHMLGHFFIIPNWLWIEKRMEEGQRWIRSAPYSVRIDGLGLSIKRLLLALKWKRPLYWELRPHRKHVLSLWSESEHERMLSADKYGEIKESESRMMVRMNKLNFFSVNTYVGSTTLLRKYQSG